MVFGVAANSGGLRKFRDETGRQKGRWLLHTLREPDLGERTRNEIACAHEAPMEHRACAPSDAHVSGLHHLERDHGGVDQVPQFMRKESEPLVVANGVVVDQWP